MTHADTPTDVLNDSTRESYRRDLLAEVVYERFGPIPWREKHRTPTPLAVLAGRSADDTPANIARRIADLEAAMTDEHGRVVPLADRRAA